MPLVAPTQTLSTVQALSPAAHGGVGWVLSIPCVSFPLCQAEGALLTPLEQRR